MLINNLLVKWSMNKKLFILFFTLSMLSCGIASISISNQIFAQLLPSLSKDGVGLGITDALKNQTSQARNNSMNLIDQAAVKKLENIYSLTNTVGMSMVNGIKVNEITIGENNVTATLNYQPTQNDTGENSLPVTVIVTKLPVENLTKFVILATESSMIASTISGSSGSLDSLIDNTKLTPDTLNIALSSLDLIKNLQTGVASATLSNLDNSQKISVETPGGLVSSLSTAPNEFVTVLVFPSMGIGPFPSNFPSIFSK